MQVLFDPFEEQLHLPTALVEFRDRQRRQGEVVGQKHESPVVLRVVKRDPAQRVGVQSRRLWTHQHNGLVASQPRCLVYPPPAAPGVVEAALGSCNEERQACCKPIKASKVDVPSIHHVERARFERQMVEVLRHRDVDREVPVRAADGRGR